MMDSSSQGHEPGRFLTEEIKCSTRFLGWIGDAIYIPPFWWAWAPPGPGAVAAAGGAASSAPGGGGAAVIWISAHSADDAAGGVILPLYGREYRCETHFKNSLFPSALLKENDRLSRQARDTYTDS